MVIGYYLYWYHFTEYRKLYQTLKAEKSQIFQNPLLNKNKNKNKELASIWKFDNDSYVFWSHGFLSPEKSQTSHPTWDVSCPPTVWSPLLLSSHLNSSCFISKYLRVLPPSLNSDLMWQGDRKQGRGGTEIKEQGIKITVPGWLSGVGPINTNNR